MPTYDFKCSKCGHEFEQLILPTVKQPKASEVDSVPCEKCNKKATRHFPIGARKHLRFHFNYQEP